MGLGVEKAGYALAEFYLSLIAYYVLHMIFVISSDFVEAFNIPPLNIGIYVDKMAAIRALLMVIADLLEWAITQKWLGDPGQANWEKGQASLTSLKDSSDFSDKWYRRLGSLLSYFAMLICRIVYIWLVYKSDNKSLSVFVTLCIEGFWFGVFQMSFFAVGPEFNAFTSFGIHTMGNFIFFTQVVLNKLAKKYPRINSLYRVRVHAWIVLITSLIALPIWITFCVLYSYGGDSSNEFQKLINEPYWFETGSFNDLVKELKSKLETDLKSDDNPEASTVVSKIKDALENKQSDVQKVVQKDFGITGSVEVKKEGDNVEVKINSSNNNLGTATVKVTKDGDSSVSQNIMIQVKGEASLTNDKGGNIAKRLVKAVEIAASGIDKLKSLTVKSDDENETVVQGYLAEKLRDAGSEKYAKLVSSLKTNRISEGDLTDATKLQGKLNEVKTQIADLVKTEFKDVKGVDTNNNVHVGTGASNTVNVTLGESGSGGENQGSPATVKGEVKIQIQKKDGVTGLDKNDNATKIALRLAKACRNAVDEKIKNANLVEALIQSNMEFGYSKEQNVSVTKEDSNKVIVTIGDDTNPKGEAKIKVKKGKSSEANITIEVKGARSTAQAGRIAYKIGQGVTNNKSKFPAVSINLDKINGNTNHVWSPLLLFIVGAFAEDFAVPGILPFAFLDPDKASLVNYLTPSFFMTGSMIIVFLNDIFEVKGFARDLGMSRFKEWSEGAADPWHGLWTLNLLKYTAFFIAMWSIHGTFDRLRCIIQSRWRVMLLTMFIVVPRATLEVAGYVGVANYAILASETSDYSGFDYIAYHDVLAMFCRFVYGKFAVGYKSTPKYSFWLKIHLNIMMWNIYSYCINIINDV